MQLISVVTAVGLAALVNFYAAEEVDMCNGGTASARDISLTIDLTSMNYRCCCHLYLKTTQVVFRNMTVDCGITLVHNVSFFDKTCKSRGSFAQRVGPGEIAFDLCAVREDCHTQTQSLHGQLMLSASRYGIDVNCSQPIPCAGSSERGVTKMEPTTGLTSTSSDIDVNCSDQLSMIPSTGSTQPGVTEVESTTELTPSTSSGVYIATAVVVAVLMCIGVACVIMRLTSVFTQASETGNPQGGVERGNLGNSPDSGYEKLHRRGANREELSLSVNGGNRESQIHESHGDYERIRITLEETCEVDTISGPESNTQDFHPDNVYNTVQDFDELPVDRGSGAGVTVGIGDTHSSHNKREILNVVQQSIQCAEERMNHDNDMLGEYVNMNGQEVSSACQEITVKENKMHTNEKTNKELGDQEMEMISHEHLSAGWNKLDINEEPNKGEGKTYKDRLVESHVVTCKANSNTSDITNEPALSVKGGNTESPVNESQNDYERIRTHEEICEVQPVPGAESNSPHVYPDNVYNTVQGLEELPVDRGSGAGVTGDIGDAHSSHNKREILNVVQQSIQCAEERMNHDNDMLGEYVNMNGQEVSSACQEITVKENKMHTNEKTNEELGDQEMEMISHERLPAGWNKLDINEEPNNDYERIRTNEEICEIQAIHGAESNSPHAQPDNVTQCRTWRSYR